MRSRYSFGQLKQVVDGTNHRPLASDLVKPTQQELPETPGVLDLPEHGFDNLFAQPVAAAAASALELRCHGASTVCSSGASHVLRRRGAITKTGNSRARRVLVEAAWTYRHSARVSQTLQDRLKGLPLAVRTITWKAQVRLCARYRRLIANGKKPAVATTAIAREIAAFLWAIGHQVEPQAPTAVTSN